MKITLQVNGRTMTFTEHEIIAIVEEHLTGKATEQVTTAKVAQKPTEGEWFEVKPQAIDQSLFKKKRKDKRQEETRQLILEAFGEVKSRPEKYGKNFKTMMPKKEWESKTVAYLKVLACKLGDHNADWVEQALEWAQRIANGESWASICNDADTANWFRMVIWKDGYARLVGGSVVSDYNGPTSDVGGGVYFDYYDINCAVPLVVFYEK